MELRKAILPLLYWTVGRTENKFTACRGEISERGIVIGFSTVAVVRRWLYNEHDSHRPKLFTAVKIEKKEV
jgi:hypothetical protein